MDIEKLMKKLKTRNPFEIAEHLRIIILKENLGTINGYYNTAFRQKFIHINYNLNEKKQWFTCAHELGHALLHPNSCTPFLLANTLMSVDRMEIEANKFAIDLLISNEEVEEYAEKGYTINQIAALTGFDKRLIKLRFKISP